MIRPLALTAFALLTACVGDESVANFGAADKVWVLSEINGAPFTARATMEFGEDGALSGQAPCNRYSTKQTAPYPWFGIGPVLATKRACQELDSETAFFKALESMTLSEVSGPVLVLSNDAEETMVFKAE
ncbi:META domain-containing protein [Planktotalea sp.]|uniref:META domain-containing protein n=1 Tax=Planktotalea sp. TaxID=2029877 RepID=UPI003299058C